MLEHARELRRDAAGLSTLEYALLFIVLLVGCLLMWNKLGRSLDTQVDSGTDQLSSALAGAQLAAASNPASASATTVAMGDDTRPLRDRSQPVTPPLSAAAGPSSGTDPNVRANDAVSAHGPAAATTPNDTRAPASDQGHASPPATTEPTSWWQDAKDYVRESAPAQFVAGIVAGAIDSTTVVTGFVPSPEDSTVYFEVGRVSGEFGAGVVQMYYGGEMMLGGAALGAGGLLAAPETLGLSLAVAGAGAVVTTTGLAVAGNGAYHAGRAFDRAWNMMTGADDGAPSAAHGGGSGRPPSSGSARLTPEEAFQEIDRMRDKVNGMEPLGERVPVPGDGTGTVALAESANGARTYAGLNSSLISQESKQLARDAFTEMKASGKLKDKQFGQGASQVLLHAEGHALLRAAKHGQLGDKVRLYVDRASCPPCRTYLPVLMEHLGVKELEIIMKSGERIRLP